MCWQNVKTSTFYRNLFIWGLTIGTYTVVLGPILLSEDDMYSTISFWGILMFFVSFGIWDIKTQTRIKWQAESICSYSWRNRFLCEVSTNEIIYYSLYRTKGTWGQSYLIISNQPFNRYDSISLLGDDYYYEDYVNDYRKVGFDSRMVYDNKHQIRLIYSNNTKNLFPLDAWIEVQSINQ